MAATSRNLDAVSLASSEFELKFFKALSEEIKGNVVCSALSVQLALAMLHTGAKGETAKKLKKALCLMSTDLEATNHGFKELVTNLQTLKVERDYFLESMGDVKTKGTLSIANKMYVKKGFPIEPPFSSALEKYFGASAQSVDFVDKATVGIINEWVEKQTNDKIKDIVAPDSFNAYTCVVLVNTVYFKCSWVEPFKPMSTKEDDFYIDERRKVRVPLMFKADEDLSYAHLEDMDAQIVELPYKMEEMSFVVVLPNKRTGLADLEEKLASRQLSDLLQLTERTSIDLFLPKFKVESTLDLTKHLAKLGLEQMFTGSADFSGISTAPELLEDPLQVSDVIQTAFIEVNEWGTEAAAATRVRLRGGGCGPPSVVPEVKCDHPFAFFVVYKRQLALFSGRLTQP